MQKQNKKKTDTFFVFHLSGSGIHDKKNQEKKNKKKNHKNENKKKGFSHKQDMVIKIVFHRFHILYFSRATTQVSYLVYFTGV